MQFVKIPISSETRDKIIRAAGPGWVNDTVCEAGQWIIPISRQTFDKLCTVQAKGETMEQTILQAMNSEIITFGRAKS